MLRLRNAGQCHKRPFLLTVVSKRVALWLHASGLSEGAEGAIGAYKLLHVGDNLAGNGVDCAAYQVGGVLLYPLRRSLIR